MLMTIDVEKLVQLLIKDYGIPAGIMIALVIVLLSILLATGLSKTFREALLACPRIMCQLELES
jgi:hypothetical protein